MKNLIFITAIVLSSIVQLLANSTPQLATLDVVANEKSVVLDLSNIAHETEIFTVIDASGEIVFTEEVTKYKNKVTYNLERLPAGSYSIKLEGNNFVEFYETLITKEEISILETNAYLRPTIQKTNNKVLVNVASKAQEDIQVYIYDQDNQLMFSYSDEKVGDYQKVFNLSNLKKGEYNVILTTEYFSEVSRISL